MNWVARWWPVSCGILVMSVIAYASTLTPRHIQSTSPLPAPVAVPALKDSIAQPKGVRSIFSALGTAPTDTGSADATPKLPSLVGIASGRSSVVVLLKGANGQIVRTHMGEVVDGWRVRAISSKSVTIGNSDGEQELRLPHAEN